MRTWLGINDYQLSIRVTDPADFPPEPDMEWFEVPNELASKAMTSWHRAYAAGLRDGQAEQARKQQR